MVHYLEGDLTILGLDSDVVDLSTKKDTFLFALLGVSYIKKGELLPYVYTSRVSATMNKRKILTTILQ